MREDQIQIGDEYIMSPCDDYAIRLDRLARVKVISEPHQSDGRTVVSVHIAKTATFAAEAGKTVNCRVWREATELCPIEHIRETWKDYKKRITVERIDRYHVLVGDGKIVATGNQEQQLRDMTADQRAAFLRLMGTAKDRL